MTDITYKDEGLFFSFWPCSKAGEIAFSEICKAQGDNTGKVLCIHAQSSIAALRRAGYRVSKAPKDKPSNPLDDDLLLGALNG